jgi:ribonuclease HI
MRTIKAYTDGSAVVVGKRKGAGGFGCYFPSFYGNKLAYSLGYEDTKTGRMEIMALLYAIESFYVNHKERVLLQVYSDSEYVVKSFTERRLQKWMLAGWTNTSGAVKNRDLWERVVKALNDRKYLQLQMIHIRSHQVEKEKDEEKKKLLMLDENIIGNMMADRLADYKRHTTLLKTDKL